MAGIAIAMGLISYTDLRNHSADPVRRHRGARLALCPAIAAPATETRSREARAEDTGFSSSARRGGPKAEAGRSGFTS